MVEAPDPFLDSKEKAGKLARLLLTEIESLANSNRVYQSKAVAGTMSSAAAVFCTNVLHNALTLVTL